MRRETLSNNRKRPPKGQTYSKRDQSPSPDPAYSQWPTYCRQSHRNHVPVFSAGKSTLFFGAGDQSRFFYMHNAAQPIIRLSAPNSLWRQRFSRLKSTLTSSYTTWGNPWSQLQTWSTAPNLEPSSDTSVSKHYIHLNKWVARYPLQHAGNVLPRLARSTWENSLISLKTSTILIWLILPVVICLSQRLSHACLSINNYTVKLRTAH